MSADNEALERITVRAFAVEFCNAPVRVGETRDEAKESIAAATPEQWGLVVEEPGTGLQSVPDFSRKGTQR